MIQFSFQQGPFYCKMNIVSYLINKKIDISNNQSRCNFIRISLTSFTSTVAKALLESFIGLRIDLYRFYLVILPLGIR